MRLILVSSNGNGAGKSYLSTKLSDIKYSLAAELREELKEFYPFIDWYSPDKKQYLDYFKMTLREKLVQYGQDKCVEDPLYWCRKLYSKIVHQTDFQCTITVDDLRKVYELEFFRERFGSNMTHLHIQYPQAVYEPEFQNEELAALADYIVTRNNSR